MVRRDSAYYRLLEGSATPLGPGAPARTRCRDDTQMGIAMPNVIQFLESLGAKPALSAAEYAAIVSGLGLREAQRKALLGADPVRIGELLNARTRMMFMISSPDPDDHEAIPDDGDGEDENGDGVPDDEHQSRE